MREVRASAKGERTLSVVKAWPREGKEIGRR